MAQTAENMTSMGRIRIETPENVCFTYPAAGVGMRAVAYFIDLCIKVLPIVAITISLSLADRLLDLISVPSLVLAGLILLIFISQWCYDVFFETFWNGAPPGKRALGIRVVMDNGCPVTFTASAVRNLLRTFDFLPVFYGIGTVAAFASARDKRIGDMAAGTIVVRDEPFDLAYLSTIEISAARAVDEPAARASLNPAEIDLITRYLKRRPLFDNATRTDLEGKIFERVSRKVHDPSGVLKKLLATGRTERYLASLLALSGRTLPRRGNVGMADFVSRNRPHWQRLAEMVSNINKHGLRSLSVEELQDTTRLYRALAGHLAYAQTFFAGTELTRILDALLARSHNHIYRSERPSRPALLEFFRRGYPALFQKNLRYFAAALYIFMAAGIFAALAYTVDERTAGLFLPANIIEDVRSGRMWTDEIFNVLPGSVASTAILTNNISVTFFAYGLGMAAGLGTVYIMALNGALLGVVIMMTSTHGMGYDLWSFVGAHGFIELFIVMVAGAAGLRTGMSLLAPGDLLRIDALKEGAREGALLVLGGAPVLVVAGFIEGYISPQNAIPGWLKIIFGLLLLALCCAWLARPVRPASQSHKDGAAAGAFTGGFGTLSRDNA